MHTPASGLASVLAWVALGLHIGLAVVAMRAALRSRAYEGRHLLRQSLLALLLPLVGPVMVLVFAREALAPLPPADRSTWDHDRIGSG